MAFTQKSGSISIDGRTWLLKQDALTGQSFDQGMVVAVGGKGHLRAKIQVPGSPGFTEVVSYKIHESVTAMGFGFYVGHLASGSGKISIEEIGTTNKSYCYLYEMDQSLYDRVYLEISCSGDLTYVDVNNWQAPGAPNITFALDGCGQAYAAASTKPSNFSGRHSSSGWTDDQQLSPYGGALDGAGNVEVALTLIL